MNSDGHSVGPERGSLFIVGGGGRPLMRKFLDLAGGPVAAIVAVPTAGEGDNFDENWARGLREAGAKNVTVLHTRDREVADSEAFVKPIEEARGVWFGGGRQWRLADAYLNTRTHRTLWELLDRGGVIGGSSAGATIQGSYLVRGDTSGSDVMMGDHEEGFGFLKQTAIDQHLLKRNRQFDLIEVIQARPELLGIGIDENTAIVVQGNRFEVHGDGYVAIYNEDTMIPPFGQFYLLAAGDRFDLSDRKASRPRTIYEPIGRVKALKWGRASGE